MKTALVLAASFALTTTACFAGEDCSKSCEAKKTGLMSKLFHKKACDKTVSSKKSDTDLQVSGTNFIIN
jgi:hypothetical protein